MFHERLAPKRHRFAYPVFMLALDLDEIPAVNRSLRLLSVNRRNLYSVREHDYFPVDGRLHNPSTGTKPVPAGTSLEERVHAWLDSRGVDVAGGRIELLTMPRIAGYLFNPVSFYFCHDADGAPRAAIAEVTNTFGEVKPYLLPPESWNGGAFRARVPKHFYVSPYSDVDVAFDFRLRPPAGRLALAIDDYTDGKRTLVSTLTGAARPLNDRSLALFVLKYPLLTLQVISRIHGHALLLYLKRVPWFAKAARASDQRDLYRPHPSLTRAAPPSA